MTERNEKLIVLDNPEERLRAEIAELKEQLAEHQRQLEQRHTPAPHGATAVPPSRTSLWLLGLGIVALIVVAFFLGFIPRGQREAVVAAEAREHEKAFPEVTVVAATRSAARSELFLPGSIQAVTEAPILARADGYVRKRYADIGDRVQAGQILAEIEAPDLDQQVRQAHAALDQAKSSVEQALANLEQGKANQELARVTAARWSNLAAKGVVSRQENDQYQAQYTAQTANVKSLEKAIAAARSNVSALEANLSRLEELKSYQKVKAPFAGVITLRNIDTGTYIAQGNTLLFRIAQTNVLRTYVNVPQSAAEAVRPGQSAEITITDLPGKRFAGTVTRNSGSLDPTTRTLLTEVQVPNTEGLLMPGMYAQVDLNTPRKDPPVLVSSDALVVRPDGTQVATVSADGHVHFQKIDVGRDYGDRIEVISGLLEGQQVVVNPGDVVMEGVKVKPVVLRAPGTGPKK